MVRVKVQMKKIENKTYRQITFAKRKSGLIKKAYELSTLCDVEVALIIFSPAGKLFLFEGNERLEEILSHLIERPARRRACQPLLQCVQNEELIRDVINKLTHESSFANHPMVSRNNRTDTDSQLLQEVQRDILLCSAQLEDVEKQLQCFLGDPSGFNSMRECQYIEMLLEQTLKLIHSRKQVLESKGNATCPEIGDAINPLMVNCTGAQKASWNGSIPPSSNWESNIDLHAPSTIGLQLSRNSEEPLAGEPPSQMMHPLAGVDLNIQPAVDGCIPHPPSGIVNPNFPPGMGITKQATKSSSGAQAGSSRRELSADLWLKL